MNLTVISLGFLKVKKRLHRRWANGFLRGIAIQVFSGLSLFLSWGQSQFCRLDTLVFLSEFGGAGGYEHTSSEQPGVDRVCSWSKAGIRGRGQENDPDLDSIHVPSLRQAEEHRQDRYATDDRR